MHIAQNWRLNKQRYAMKAARCEKCGEVSFPPREVCPVCQEHEARERAAQNAAKLREFPAMAVAELERASR